MIYPIKRIIVQCLSSSWVFLHVSLYLLTYIDISWRDQNFAFTLYELLRFFVPCMRPTPRHIRMHIATCHHSMKNETCYYNDVLKHICFSFYLSASNLANGNCQPTPREIVASDKQSLDTTLTRHFHWERKYGSVRVAIIYWLSNMGGILIFMAKNKSECE